jgi:GTP-binding protein EngB required for normal cell division
MNESCRITAPDRATPRRRSEGESDALAAVLGRVEPALESAMGSGSQLVQRFRRLYRRLEHERLQLAVLGQFKRGKSTFINALLGAAVLPTGVVPLTAVATFIAWAQAPGIVVHFKDAQRTEQFSPQTVDEIRDVLFRFVAEEGNSENQLGVERVELFYPADILADGTVIIDTPGVGSTLRHNTEAALQVLPECDAAFFVVSADPPITEVELDFLRRLKSKIPRVFFVLNKADYLRTDEQRSVVDFLQRVLAEKSLIDADGRIFCISARYAVEAKERGDRRALGRSGVAALEDHLLRSLARDKNRWLEDAVRGKADDILARSSAELKLRARALSMPVEELAAKSNEFQEALRSIEDQRRVTRDVLAGDHRRLRGALDSRIETLRKEVAVQLGRVIDTSLSDAVPKTWEEAARRALTAALQAEFEAAREPLVSDFAADASAALLASQGRIDALVRRVRQSAAEIFNVLLGPDTEYEPFELGEDPYWVTETTALRLIPDPSRLLDRMLPAPLRRPRLRARMMRQAEELIIRNAENLRWAIWRGLDETLRKATTHFEERLDETISATRNVINEALIRRREQSFAVQPELHRLDSAIATLSALRSELLGGRPQPA